MNVANVTVLTANSSGLTYVPTGNVNINVGSTTSLTLGNVTVSNLLTTNGGIKFPATQVSSADGNTLDDYEEGTWTPVLTRDGTAPTISYTTREATYVKIGSMVYCQLLVNISSVSSNGSGLNQIAGLPFTAKADSRWGGIVSLNMALPSAEAFYILGNNTAGYFWNLASPGNTNANYVTNQLYMTFVYQTA
jgi:hypothetical protein